MIPRKKREGSKRSAPKSERTNPSSALIIYKGPTQLTNPNNNADADKISRSIVVLTAIPPPNAVQIQSLTFNSYPDVSSADWVKFVGLYTEYRVLSQVIEYIPNVSTCDNGIPIALGGSATYPGIIVAKVARGNTAPTLALFTDVDTACKIEPLCFTGCRRLAKINMSSVEEAVFSDTNTPQPVWISTVSLFYGVLMPNYGAASGVGNIKVTTLVQFRGAE